MGEEPNPVKAELCEQHPEWWIVGEKPATNYFDKANNYLIPEVKDRMLRLYQGTA
jgi:hypothetical protein